MTTCEKHHREWDDYIYAGCPTCFNEKGYEKKIASLEQEIAELKEDNAKGLEPKYKEGDWVQLGGVPKPSRLFDALPANLTIQLGRRFDDGFGWWSPELQMGFRIYHKLIMCHMPDQSEPKERTPHWVHVRDGSRAEWKKRILDNANGQIGYRCVFDFNEKSYIAGNGYGVHIWQYMQEIPKRVPWTAQDYAKRQIVYLKEKGNYRIYRIQEVIKGDWLELIPFNSDKGTIKWQDCDNVAKNHTLPDGTELYKDEGRGEVE